MNEEPTLSEALAELVPGGPTGDLEADIRAAVAETWRRRKSNTAYGAVVLSAILDRRRPGGLTYRQLEVEFGIPKTTANRWATPPDQK